MEIRIVITTVVVITTILIILLNNYNKKIDASSSKKVNTQKLSDKSFIGKTDELLNLKKLLDEEVITQEEFEKAKEELLNINNQKNYEIEREKIISGKDIQQSSDKSFEEETSSFTDKLLIIFWGFAIFASFIALFLLFFPLFPF